ncbi:hypothetical protein [Pseudonocardia abyssalis]|uniref:Uncharacterized protein n=1 Tax=Pseudonocardia abyssalis TaxID=2792008 RepID=A0ABS6UXJ6_9PSEU|nr:hypothetical protein [Pseudonocardia abyssalis]MBW0113941.1 hypothetical protein [Pseudonocardia abyssalis]MBW0136975.1 hypothetical protein [Pseudonocardia abyssalis]
MDGPTRRSLHGVAELIIAGPQHRAHGTIRLRVTQGGFGGVAVPLRVEGTDLVWDGGRSPLTGTYRSLAAVAGIADPGAPDSYADTSGVGLDEEIAVDAVSAAALADWFARGDAALRAFAPDLEPVLWPEHFDLALTVDEVNYGVSPGDAGHPDPYAYVGPWTPRQGPFWNADFGALRPASELPDVTALAAFFAEGRAAER